MAVLEILIRSIPNSYKVKKNYLDNLSNEIEVLIFGSSHTYNGLNPELFNLATFNAANNSQFLDYDYEIFKRYESHLDNLEYIVIPISYFSLFATMDNAFEPWRIKNYNIYYKFQLSHSPKYYSEVLSNRLDVNMRRLVNYYIYEKSDTHSSKLGWNMHYREKENSDLELEQNGELTAKLQSVFDTENSKDIEKMMAYNLNILNNIINWSKENQVKVIFVTPPAYFTFTDNLSQKQLQIISKTVQQILLDNTNCFYFDFLNHPNFDKGDYEDSHHLNASGAQKFSILVNGVIENLRREDNTSFYSLE